MATVRYFARHSRSGGTPSNQRSICAAAIGLLLLAPLFAVIYLVLRLAGEAPFTRQQYVREDGASVTVWRFNAAGLLEERAEISPNPVGRWLRPRVGAFLYDSRLDLLPTFYNVLRGEISLQDMLREICE